MGINHCCTHITVAKKFLDCPYIVSVFQQVSCKRMTKGVATCVFIDASFHPLATLPFPAACVPLGIVGVAAGNSCGNAGLLCRQLEVHHATEHGHEGAGAWCLPDQAGDGKKPSFYGAVPRANLPGHQTPDGDGATISLPNHKIPPPFASIWQNQTLCPLGQSSTPQ